MKTLGVPVPNDWQDDEIVSGHPTPVDVSLHFRDARGTMRAFREFVEELRSHGHTVELTHTEQRYPVARVVDASLEWKLTLFGPPFDEGGKSQPVQIDVGERVEARIQADDGAALDEAA